MDTEMKEKLKDPLLLDVRMVFSKISERGKLNRDTALEAGSYIGAQFINTLNKLTQENGEAALTMEEHQNIFEVLNEILSEEVNGEFTRVDFEIMKEKALDVLNSPKVDEKVIAYFNKVLKKEE